MDHSKNILGIQSHIKIISVNIVLLCLIALVMVYALGRKKEIRESQLFLWNDLRSEYLYFEIKLNDSVLFKSPKNRNEDSSLSLKLPDGTYVLQTIINSKPKKQKFTIKDNNEKYIYISFNDKISKYVEYFSIYENILLKQKTASKKITREQLRNIMIDIRNTITIENLKSLGYNPENERLQIHILDRPSQID